MPPKKSKAVDDDLDALFSGIDDSSTSAPRKATRPANAASISKGTGKPKPDDEENALLAELEGLTAEHRAPSRPVTPRIPRTSVDSVRKSSDLRNSTEAPKATEEEEEESEEEDDDDDDDDEDDEEDEEDDDEEEEGEDEKKPARLPLKHEEKRAAPAPQHKQQPSGGGGWGWGGSIWSTASAAMNVAQSTAAAAATTAQGVYKEALASEEAKKWTEQVKGTTDQLKSLGDELQKRAIPTFTNLLQHIAPPISSHERLHIHTAHDLVSYPSIDPIIYAVFSRVMQQVDGGELMVVQRGAESTKKRDVDVVGWGGGPWWRDERKRDLGACFGLEEGVKLVRVTADTYATEYLAQSPTGDGEGVVRKSDIFMAIQPTTYTTPSYYTPTAAASPEGNVTEPKEEPENLTVFAIHLTDPAHLLSFTTVSQAFPAKWGEWMDAKFEDLPEDMQMGLANGAVDPREWIAEWMEETLALAVGTVAQRYVSRRMGVGEGLGKGKERAVIVPTEKAGGEEARAI